MTILSLKKALIKKVHLLKKLPFKRAAKISFWFSLGAILGFFFFISFLYIFYKQTHTNLIYEGVMVNGIDFGGKTKDDVRKYFTSRNDQLAKTQFIITAEDMTATLSARQANFGYDANLLSQQAFSIGRSNNLLSNISLITQAYLDGVRLPPAYHYDEKKLDKIIAPLQKHVHIEPINGEFRLERGKVTAFRLSKYGRTLDAKTLKEKLLAQMFAITLSNQPQNIQLKAPIVPVPPTTVSARQADKLGIKELIGQGTSLFHHSIENRIYNLNLAATRLNGILIPPGQTFSFTKTLGDVSSFTGYKQAYVIENGKTVLGDGGGVCQVSTTLFRAVLNTGLPVIERHPHAYRVGYYEQDSGPGVDAAIYSPTVDLKFKNDTGSHILIQSFVDYAQSRLTFELYGTKDNRQVTIGSPIILSQAPAPEPLYQDDPTLPKGQVKQIDFAAPGANVYFTRSVKKDGKVHLSDKFTSNYRPWQAVFLRGTKE